MSYFLLHHPPLWFRIKEITELKATFFRQRETHTHTYLFTFKQQALAAFFENEVIIVYNELFPALKVS